MTVAVNSSLVSSVQGAAEKAGLVLQSVNAGSDFHGESTTIFQLGLADATNRSLQL